MQAWSTGSTVHHLDHVEILCLSHKMRSMFGLLRQVDGDRHLLQSHKWTCLSEIVSTVLKTCFSTISRSFWLCWCWCELSSLFTWVWEVKSQNWWVVSRNSRPIWSFWSSLDWRLRNPSVLWNISLVIPPWVYHQCRNGTRSSSKDSKLWQTNQDLVDPKVGIPRTTSFWSVLWWIKTGGKQCGR